MEKTIMAFPPPKGIYEGKLTKADPSQFDAATLTAQLEATGLNCSQLTPEYLSQRITEVTSQVPLGQIQSYAITAPANSPGVKAFAAMSPRMLAFTAARPSSGDVTSFAVAAPQLAETATGNWTINNQAEGYSPHL